MLKKYIEEALTKLSAKYREIRDYRVEDLVLLGRSMSLGNYWEIELANSFSKYFIEKNKNNIWILVDYPITLHGRRNPYYYDILIVELDNSKSETEKNIRNNREKIFEIGKLNAIVETKIDLGYVDLSEGGVKNFKYKDKNFSCVNNFLINYSVGNRRRTDNKYPRLKIRKEKEYNKFSIIVTENNAHGRITKYANLMDKINYNLIFLLDEKNSPRNDLNYKNVKENLNKQVYEKYKECWNNLKNL